MDEHLRDYLGKHNIEYKLHKHRAVHTVEESGSDETIMDIPGLHCKTLFLRDDFKRYYLVGMPAHKRLDIKKLEKHLGVKKLKFGTEDELKNFGLKAGSVSIFGAIYSRDVMLILDKEVWDAGIVGFHPNVNTETLELKHGDLDRYYSSLRNRKEIVEV